MRDDQGNLRRCDKNYIHVIFITVDFAVGKTAISHLLCDR